MLGSSASLTSKRSIASPLTLAATPSILWHSLSRSRNRSCPLSIDDPERGAHAGAVVVGVFGIFGDGAEHHAAAGQARAVGEGEWHAVDAIDLNHVDAGSGRSLRPARLTRSRRARRPAEIARWRFPDGSCCRAAGARSSSPLVVAPSMFSAGKRRSSASNRLEKSIAHGTSTTAPSVSRPRRAPRRRFRSEPEPSASNPPCGNVPNGGSSVIASRSGFCRLRSALGVGSSPANSRIKRPGALFASVKHAEVQFVVGDHVDARADAGDAAGGAQMSRRSIPGQIEFTEFGE